MLLNFPICCEMTGHLYTYIYMYSFSLVFHYDDCLIISFDQKLEKSPFTGLILKFYKQGLKLRN